MDYINITHKDSNCICCKTLRLTEDKLFCVEHRKDWFTYWSTKYGFANVSNELILKELNFFVKTIKNY